MIRIEHTISHANQMLCPVFDRTFEFESMEKWYLVILCPKILYFHDKITKKGTLEMALSPFGTKKALKIAGEFEF